MRAPIDALRTIHACAVILLVGYLGISKPPSPSPSIVRQRQQQQTRGQNGGSGNPHNEIKPADLFVAPKIDHQNREAQHPKTESGISNPATSQEDDMTNIWIAIFTGIAAFATVATCGVYWKIHSTMKKIERAWVSLDTLSFERYGHNGPTVVVIGLKNSGQTPAYIVTANVTLRAMMRDENPGRSDIRMWVYGFLEYRDTFNAKKTHTYRWAREYDQDLSRLRGRTQFTYVTKSRYNYAD